MCRDSKADPPVWIWQSDGTGTDIETDLLDAARRNWGRVRSYAQRYDQDTSVAADIFEETLLATSKARKRHARAAKPIRNLDSYLYVAFIRKFSRHLAMQPDIEYVGSVQDLDARIGVNTQKSRIIEDDLLVREVLQMMNQRARRTFFFRGISGYSWKETATFLRTTANSAQVLFNQAVGKVRTRISKRGSSKRRPGKEGEADG